MSCYPSAQSLLLVSQNGLKANIYIMTYKALSGLASHYSSDIISYHPPFAHSALATVTLQFFNHISSLTLQAPALSVPSV